MTAADTSPPDVVVPRMDRTALPAVVIVLVLVVGVFTSSAMWLGERSQAATADRRAAERGAAAFAGAVGKILGSLRGVDGIGVDGEVSSEEFVAFVSDVVEDSDFDAIALQRVVPHAELDAFEAASGLVVRDTDGRGGFVVARPRTHFVVTEVHPSTEESRRVLGFDVASDPVRRNAVVAAQRTRRPTLSEPISLASSGDPGLFVAQTVTDPTGEVLAVVSSGISVDALMQRAVDDSSMAGAAQLRFSGRRLWGPPEVGGATSNLAVAGQRFTVVADDPNDGSPLVALGIMLSSALIAGLIGWATRRNRRLTLRLLAANDRSSLLAELSRDLATRSSREAVEQSVSTYGGGVVGAKSCRIVTGEVETTTDALVARALGSGGLVIETSPTARAAAPMTNSHGLDEGVITFDWTTPPLVTPGLRTTLETLTELCAQTLERAELGAREHDLVVQLQRKLLRPIPDVGPFRSAARYQPASATAGMGGDWYSGIERDGSLVVTIGDVTGHGVEAVAVMAQLQSVANGLVSAGGPLDDILATVSSVLASTHGLLASAQVFQLDGRDGTVRYGNAGHPWAMVRMPDGVVRQLAEVHGPLLGVDGRRRPLTITAFPPGALLLAYTDGLIERRTETITDSIDHLARRFASADANRPVEDVLDQIIDGALADLVGVNADDVAACLIRHCSPSG